MNKDINITFWDYFCLCEYGFKANHFVLDNQLRLSPLYWISNNNSFAGEDNSPSNSRYQWPVIPYLEVWLHGILSLYSNMSIDIPLVQIFLCSHFYKRPLHRRLLLLWLLQSFCLPLLWWSLRHRCRSCFVNVSSWALLPTVHWLLHWVQLWFSVMASICFKEKLHWWSYA